MTRRYTIAEARSRLPAIVDEADAGLDVELTRRGKPVAAVVSLREIARLRGRRLEFGETYRRFLAKYSLDDVGVDSRFVASLRDRTPGRGTSL